MYSHLYSNPTLTRCLFVGNTIHPHEAWGTVRIRKLPLSPSSDSGNCSFGMVAGTRYEAEKNNFYVEIDELLRLVFGQKRTVLVPS